LRRLFDALSLAAIDDPISGDEVRANSTTQIDHNHDRPTNFPMRSATDARETLHMVSLALRDLRSTTIPEAYLTSVPDVPVAIATLFLANTTGGKHA